MNLAEAFSTLAKTGCRLRVEAEGGIILDVSPGCPPVPPSVLQVLAAHRESLVAVLAPAKPSPRTDDRPIGQATKLNAGRPSPYAAENLAITHGPRPAPVRGGIDLRELFATNEAADLHAAPTPKAQPKENDPGASTAPRVTICWGSPVPTRGVVAPPANPQHLDPQAIRAKARARLLKLRDRLQVEGSSPDGPTPGPTPAMGVAGTPSTDDGIPF